MPNSLRENLYIAAAIRKSPQNEPSIRSGFRTAATVYIINIERMCLNRIVIFLKVIDYSCAGHDLSSIHVVCM